MLISMTFIYETLEFLYNQGSIYISDELRIVCDLMPFTVPNKAIGLWESVRRARKGCRI